jgi:hypothetical protein
MNYRKNEEFFMNFFKKYINYYPTTVNDDFKIIEYTVNDNYTVIKLNEENNYIFITNFDLDEDENGKQIVRIFRSKVELLDDEIVIEMLWRYIDTDFIFNDDNFDVTFSEYLPVLKLISIKFSETLLDFKCISLLPDGYIELKMENDISTIILTPTMLSYNDTIINHKDNDWVWEEFNNYYIEKENS